MCSLHYWSIIFYLGFYFPCLGGTFPCNLVGLFVFLDTDKHICVNLTHFPDRCLNLGENTLLSLYSVYLVVLIWLRLEWYLELFTL